MNGIALDNEARMNSSINVLLLNYYKYPGKDAGSLRQYAFSKMFCDLGGNVFIVGMGDSTQFKPRVSDEFPYISLRYPKNDLISKIKNYFSYKNNLRRLLENQAIQYDVILINDIPYPALTYCKSYAIQRNAILLYDSVEWYSPNQYRLRWFSPQYILKDLYMRHWINGQFKVIAISKFIESHFADKRRVTVRIPAALDVLGTSHTKRTNISLLTLVYAGSPGKKDYLKEIIDGITLLNIDSIKKIQLRIIGINRKQLLNECNVDKQAVQHLGDSLVLKGRISRDEVLNNLEEADFTVLMRSPTQRYAKAGFPTKVVESLTSATPVICNITSDLGDYLVDGENAIIVNECSAHAFSLALKKAIDMTFEQRCSMYAEARKCAEENFDYRLYGSTISGLIKDKCN